VTPSRSGRGWSAGITVELAAPGSKGGGEFGGDGFKLVLTLCEQPDSGLDGPVAAGEVGDSSFEMADRNVESGGFGNDVGVPPLVGVGFSLLAFRELAGGLAPVPASLTVLSEPFDLAPLFLRSEQPGDGLTGGRGLVNALAGVEVNQVVLGLMQSGDRRLELDRVGGRPDAARGLKDDAGLGVGDRDQPDPLLLAQPLDRSWVGVDGIG
jgi:hypothetical protein